MRTGRSGPSQVNHTTGNVHNLFGKSPKQWFEFLRIAAGKQKEFKDAYGDLKTTFGKLSWKVLRFGRYYPDRWEGLPVMLACIKRNLP